MISWQKLKVLLVQKNTHKRKNNGRKKTERKERNTVHHWCRCTAVRFCTHRSKVYYEQFIVIYPILFHKNFLDSLKSA
jgi:hypothetical protein